LPARLPSGRLFIVDLISLNSPGRFIIEMIPSEVFLARPVELSATLSTQQGKLPRRFEDKFFAPWRLGVKIMF
jgi:hypothetical protein